MLRGLQIQAAKVTAIATHRSVPVKALARIACRRGGRIRRLMRRICFHWIVIDWKRIRAGATRCRRGATWCRRRPPLSRSRRRRCLSTRLTRRRCKCPCRSTPMPTDARHRPIRRVVSIRTRWASAARTSIDVSVDKSELYEEAADTALYHSMYNIGECVTSNSQAIASFP